MPHSSAARQRAAGADALSGRAIGSIPPARRRPLSTAERLSDLSAQLDGLIRDISFTPQPRSHHEVDRRIAEAEEIADGIRAVFRAPSRSENRPLRSAGGQAWW
jgi:hypothetical protein